MRKKTNSIEEIKNRLKKLKTRIRQHDHHYYNLDQPEISDYEYDRLFQELTQIETKYPELIEPDSPSQRVPGKALSQLKKVFHKKPMLSLQNTYNENEILSFHEKMLKTLQCKQLNFLLEPKLDGVAINLLYEKGHLIQALTRGDGSMGENVLENIKTIRTIPLKIPLPDGTLEIRGEVVLLKEDFKKINEQQEEQGLGYFANPRNMAAGSLRQLDSSVTARRPLRFFAHSPGFFTGLKSKNQMGFLQQIKTLGLPVLPVMNFNSFRNKNKNKTFAACVLCKNKEEILEYFHIIEKIKHQLKFEIDGIVIKVNNFSEQEIIGEIRRFPRWARAAKFEPERGQTCIENISIQVGRTGVLTPVAHLKPVQVGGVTITHATLHNQSEISKKDIRAGDTVIVGRAGDVIPEVIKVDLLKRKKSAVAFKMPEICPSCKSKVQVIGDIVFCINPLCPSVVLQSLIHFASKKAMNIESLGSKIMERLHSKKLVQKFSDIYQLTKEKLLTVEGMGEKSSENILSSIEKSKKVSLPSFLFALGIRHIGEQTAHSLSSFSVHYVSQNKSTTTSGNKSTASSKANISSGSILIENISNATEEQLKEIPDVGEVITRSIQETFSRVSFMEEINRLFALGIQIEAPIKASNEKSPLLGKKIAITGNLPQSRTQVEKLIRSLGGQVQNTVNKQTHFLLCGQPKEGSPPSQKEKQAKKLNTPVWDWKLFQEKASL